MISNPRCERCGSRDKLLLCSRCKKTYYCCKQHQVADWKRHKKNCRTWAVPASVSTGDEPGRGPLCDLSCLCDDRLFPKTDIRRKNRADDQETEETGREEKDEEGNRCAEASKPPEQTREDDSLGNIHPHHLAEVRLAAFEDKSKRQEVGIVEEMCRNVIQDMDSYGVCVVDRFLGRERGMEVLREVKEMYSKGLFEDGQLVNSRGSQDLKTIRSDRIAWLDGKDPACPNIDMLVSEVDNIVIKSNRMENNGKMGDFLIDGRTKAMVACYPGDGAHYVKHVDNPNKDGRCITAIYYLNPDWDVEKDGGLLRIFPEGWADQVADIAPLFDRVLFFWSDRRNPHEVQPSYKTRYAITLWYFDAAERKEACKRFLNMNKRL